SKINHKIIVSHRVVTKNESYHIQNITPFENTLTLQTTTNKSLDDVFYNELKQYGTTWELDNLEKSISEKYINDISGSKGNKILAKIPKTSRDIIKMPLFLNFINWIALYSDDNTIGEIESLSKLYLIFTRKKLKREFDILKDSNDKSDNWLLLGESNSKLQNNTYIYTLDKIITPIELLLCEIANKLGFSFTKEALENEIRALINQEKMGIISKNIKLIYQDVEQQTLERKVQFQGIYPEYFYTFRLLLLSKYDEDITISQLIESLIKNTLLKDSGDGEISFYHQSVAEFYIALRLFYNQNLQRLELDQYNKFYFEDSLNKIDELSKKDISIDNIRLFIIEFFELDVYSKMYYEYLKDLDLTYLIFFSIASLYNAKEEYEKAIEFYNKSISINPNFYNAYNNLGNVYKAKEEYDKAIEYHKKALELSPNSYISYNGLGNVYYSKKEYDKAIEYHKKALELSPDNYLFYNNLGDVYKAKKEYDKAIEFYNKSISINPNFEYTYNGLGDVYYSKKEYDKAIEYHKKA
ncbi:MAG: tetratricopeptide repeat protein, partial [Cyanobacteriota bacterium]